MIEDVAMRLLFRSSLEKVVDFLGNSGSEDYSGHVSALPRDGTQATPLVGTSAVRKISPQAEQRCDLCGGLVQPLDFSGLSIC
jgi:hypothetical protein